MSNTLDFPERINANQRIGMMTSTEYSTYESHVRDGKRDNYRIRSVQKRHLLLRPLLLRVWASRRIKKLTKI